MEIQLVKNKNEEQANEEEGQAVLNIYDDKKRFPYHHTVNEIRKAILVFLGPLEKEMAFMYTLRLTIIR